MFIDKLSKGDFSSSGGPGSTLPEKFKIFTVEGIVLAFCLRNLSGLTQREVLIILFALRVYPLFQLFLRRSTCFGRTQRGVQFGGFAQVYIDSMRTDVLFWRNRIANFKYLQML